jgi:lactoylglutathione lyase
MVNHWRVEMKVNKVVPFFAVKDMETSLAFYIEGLGFEIDNKWVKEGAIRWCHLQLGGAGLMLQQFKTEGHDSRQFSDNKGDGVSLCFFCDDVVSFFKELKDRELEASEPQVGNAAWVTNIQDPDGYRLAFQSPTDTPEGTKLLATRLRHDKCSGIRLHILN